MTSSSPAQLQFYDRYWASCFEMLSRFSQPNSAIIGPSEFIQGFEQYYIYEYYDICDEPDFVVVHKGMIDVFSRDFLRNISKTMRPLFANEVFIILGVSGTPGMDVDRHMGPFYDAVSRADVQISKNTSSRNLGDLLREGEFRELQSQVLRLRHTSESEREKLIEISFQSKDWRRLYALTYDDSDRLNFTNHLLHCYSAVSMGVADEITERFPDRIASFTPRYDTTALRLLELASLSEVCNRAVSESPLMLEFIRHHCLPADFRWIRAIGGPSTVPDEPIDAVYTWFDPDDPKWASDRLRYTENDDGELTGAARFGNIGEIYLSINLLVRNVPYIRNIFIIHGDQQEYFDTSRLVDAARVRLKFVSHSSYVRREVRLPTFNSDAIESCFDRVSELSETFLYLNDDCFVARPIKKIELFAEGGVPRILANHKIWKKEDLRIRGASTSDRDSLTLRSFMDRFGSAPRFVPAHQLMICTKRAIARTWEIFPIEMEKYVGRQRLRDYTSLQFMKLTAWIADREQRQRVSVLAPDKEIFRRGISPETLTAARHKQAYFYSLNNMNEDSVAAFKELAEILLNETSTADGAFPGWSA